MGVIRPRGGPCADGIRWLSRALAILLQLKYESLPNSVTERDVVRKVYTRGLGKGCAAYAGTTTDLGTGGGILERRQVYRLPLVVR